ncbi:MAG: hypothetical protein H0V35_15165, partial [Nitrospira sp.]|nr:hypothetical protein [Nitrospira sp.]
MFSKRSAVQCAVLSGLVLGSAFTSHAQSGAPVQEQPGEVGPRTGDRVIQDRDRTIQERDRATHDRTVARDRTGAGTVVEERVVERRQEGEVYVSGFG